MNKKIINPFACFGFKEQSYFDSFYNNQNKECNDVSNELGEIKDKVANNEKKNTDQDKEIKEIKDANTNFKVEVSEEAGANNILKTYSVKQGGEEIGKINIPVDSFVESGSYDKEKNELTLNIKGGEKITIPLTDLINDTDLVQTTKFDEYKEAVKEQLETKADKTVIPTDYVTKEELKLKADKNEIPTKLSQLENDSNYLTEHQDISGLATKVELNEKADKSDIPTDFYSKQEVDNKIDSNKNDNKSAIDAINVELVKKANKSDVETNTKAITEIKNDYAKKTELDAKQDTISDIDDIRNGASKGATALQEIPSEYAKKSDIPKNISVFNNDANYLKEHQDISGLAKNADLTGHTSNADIHVTVEDKTKWNGKLDATAYTPYNDSELKTDIQSNKNSITTLNNSLETKANKSDIPTDFYSKQEVDTKLAGKQDKAIVEEFKFTLEDGSIVTKNILIFNQTN